MILLKVMVGFKHEVVSIRTKLALQNQEFTLGTMSRPLTKSAPAGQHMRMPKVPPYDNESMSKSRSRYSTETTL